MPTTTGESITVAEQHLAPRHPNDNNVDDIVELNGSSESAVLHCLQERFRKRRIYTSLSDNIIFVNPNERFPIYDEKVVNQFVGSKKENPHIFSLVRQTLDKVQDGSASETIFFRGESGSGKSANALHAMRFVVAAAPSRRRHLTPQHMEAIHKIFTSFGSAKTRKTDGSTRFGYMATFFLRDHCVEGLALKTAFPLEVSRVVGQHPGERNFNILHEIVAGLPASLKSEFGIKSDHKFFYLNQAGRGEQTDEKDELNFNEVDAALDLVGFTEDQMHSIYKTLASILHIGNIYYRQRKLPNGADAVDMGCEKEAQWTATLLETAPAQWTPSFVSKLVKTENGVATVAFNIGQALDCRDSIAQLLYEELFNWILTRISQFFKCTDHTAVINIMDTYGFERYASNSLQQLCINTVSEKLHNIYVRAVFKDHLDALADDGLTSLYQMPGYLDNERILEMLVKKPNGILPLLDDECKFPKASDDTFLQHVNLNHLDKQYYGKSRNKERAEFSVRHYHGNTWYFLHDFVRGNRRAVPASLVHALANSQNTMIAQIFRGMGSPREAAEYIVYSGMQFSVSLQQINEKLAGTNIRFVNCIRANNEREISKFDLPTIARQLKVTSLSMVANGESEIAVQLRNLMLIALSISETKQLHSEGYPVRMAHIEFARRYRCLLPGFIAVHQKTQEIINDVITGQGSSYRNDALIGCQKVFLRERLHRRLEWKREGVIHSSAVTLQKALKGHTERKRFLGKKRAALVIQAGYRGWKARRQCLDELDKRKRTIAQEVRRNKRLEAYYQLSADDETMNKKPITSLGPVDFMDVGEDVRRTLESPFGSRSAETKTIHHYLTTPAQLHKPCIAPISIEQFADENFKGHLLEVRREPIMTPFLMKSDEPTFQQSLVMFKMVLKYMNDTTLRVDQSHLLARILLQMAIGSRELRDELFVQLCNQTYRNRNKANADRAFNLLLACLNTFPPSALVLPMLLSYFAQQPQPLQSMLNEALLRKIQTIDQTMTRMYAPNSLEQQSFVNRQTIVVQIQTPEGGSSLVEAHPWATAEEVAARVLKQRGIANAEGWTVTVENENSIYAPAGGYFLHDVISDVEGSGCRESKAFFSYPPTRLVPQGHSSRPESRRENGINKIRSSPVEKRRDRSAPTHITIGSNEEVICPDYNAYEQERNDIYSCTLPRKKMNNGASVVGSRKGSAMRSRSRDHLDDSLSDIDDEELMRNVTRAPSANTMRRYRDHQNVFNGMRDQANQMSYVPQGAMQYVQVMPVMLTPQGVPMMSSMYGTMPRTPSRMTEGRSVFAPSPVNLQHEDMERSSRMGTAKSGLLKGHGCERVPSEYSNMSVASRIRRIPVPRENKDVDRFLDEVFEQVLTPHEYTQQDASARRIAASIKGGYRTVEPRDVQSPRSGRGLNRTLNSNKGESTNHGHYTSDDQGYAYVERRAPQSDNYYDIRNNSSSNYYEMQEPRRGVKSPVETDNDQVYGTGARRPRERHMSSRQSNRDEGMNTAQRRNRHHSQPARAQYDSVGYQSFGQPMFMMMPMQMPGMMPAMQQGMDHEHTMQPLMNPQMMMAPQMMFCMPPQRSGEPTRSYSSMEYHNYSSESPIGDEVLPPRPATRDIPVSPINHPFESGPPKMSVANSPVDRNIPRVATKKMGLSRTPLELYTTPPVQNQVSNTEHPVPNKLPLTGIQFAKQLAEREKEALHILAAREKELPPPVDSISVLKPKPKPKPAPKPPSPPPEPEEPPSPPPVLQTAPPPAQQQWVQECEVQHTNTRPKLPSVDTPTTPAPMQRPPSAVPMPVPSPTRQRPALTYAKQPWRLTIRKEMFHPNERLDDVTTINMVFAQIIEDCRRSIPYRIRLHEREVVKDILKSHRVPPEQLARPEDVPIHIKVKIIEAARKWPLYFNQVHEVIEERQSENIFLLLAIGETGLRLLVQVPENTEAPLKIHDHFSYDDIHDVSVENNNLVVIHTRSGMRVVLRTSQAEYIRSQIEKCLVGETKERKLMRAVADYVTNEPNLLSFVKGDIIEIVPRDGQKPQGEGWLYGKIGNRYGNLPEVYVQSLDAESGELQSTNDTTSSPLPLPVDDIEINDYNFDDGYYDAENGRGNKHTMMEFALMYFRGAKEGTHRRGDDWNWADVAEKVKWTARPIHHSLLLLGSSAADKIAVQSFNFIQRYMGEQPLKRGETLTDCVYQLLMTCRKHEAMRDEIFCQIIKQTTNNKSAVRDSCLLGWRLFSILTAYFTCSQTMWPFLSKFLIDTANDSRRAYHSSAQNCLQNLSKTKKYGGRKFLLSGQEIEEITSGRIFKRQQYLLPGGLKKLVNTKSVTVVEEVIQELCALMNIRSANEQQEFCLCYALENEKELVFCSNDEYIIDLCTELERQEKKFDFLLRRTVWIHPLRLDNSVYIDVMFFQLLPDYLEGLFCSRTASGQMSAAALDDIARLGALLYVSAQQRHQPINTRNVHSLVPKTVVDRNINAEQWASRVTNKLGQINIRMTPTQARANFLETLEKWPLFGATLFGVETSSNGEPRQDCVLAVLRHGLQQLQPTTLTVQKQWPFTQVLSTDKHEQSGERMIDIKLGTVANHQTLTVRTSQAVDIDRIIGQYIYVDSSNRGIVGGPAEN